MPHSFSRVANHGVPGSCLPPSMLYNNLSFIDKYGLLIYASRKSCVVMDTQTNQTRVVPIGLSEKDTLLQCTAVLPPSVLSGNTPALILITTHAFTQLWTTSTNLGTIPHNEADGHGSCGAIVALKDTSMVYMVSGTSNGVVIFTDFDAAETPPAFHSRLGVKAHGNYAVTAARLNSFPNSPVFALTGDVRGLVVFWNHDRQPLQTVQLPECVTALQLVSSAEYAVAATGAGKIHIMLSRTGEMRVEVCAHARWINVLTYSEIANTFLSAAEDGYVTLWSAPSTETNGVTPIAPLATLHVPNGLPTGADFTTDGQHIVVALYDSDIVTQYKIE